MQSGEVRTKIRGKALKRGEQLMAATGLDSWSDLINVLLFRYGTHLIETWEVKPTPGAALTIPEPQPLIEPSVEPTSIDFTFNEPLTGL